MFGPRFSRAVDGGDGMPLSRMGVIPRRQNVYGGMAEGGGGRGNNRGGKAAVDDEARMGGARGEFRVSAFLGGKARDDMEQVDRHRSDDPYASIADRRAAARDDGMLKLVRTSENAALRAEGGGVRFRDGHRGERIGRPNALVYSEDSKWVMKGYDAGLNYGTGPVGSLRDSDYLPAPKGASDGGSSILPGFVYECPRRAILEFSAQKGSFPLPFVDRRLSRHVGPGTKIFMYDGGAREMHGVFQAESFPDSDLEPHPLRISGGSAAQVRIRVVKECMPLTERQFKEILHENYYTNSKFTESLSKEQVMKMLQTFRPADPDHALHLPLPSSRRALDSAGPPHAAQDFHGISDELVYRRNERWRRAAGNNARPFGARAYQGDIRFPSKLPPRALEEYEDYVDDEAEEEDVPVSPPPPRMVTGSNPYPSRDKIKFAMSFPPKSVAQTEYKLAGAAAAVADWREDIDSRGELLYRKSQVQSPSPPDELKRGGRSSSPSPPMSGGWKDALSEVYERPAGRGTGFKEELSYLKSRRRRHNDIDLNMPLDMEPGDPDDEEQQQQQAQQPKVGGVRRGFWNDEDEEEYSVSPPQRRASSVRLSDHLIPTRDMEEYDEARLDSRQMMNVTRKDLSFVQAEEKGRAVTGAFSDGKFGRPQLRPSEFVKKYSKDKVFPNSFLVRKKPFPGKDSYARETVLRGPKAPVFQIKANLQPALGRGRPERVVTMVDKEDYCSWGPASAEGFGNGSAIDEGRKRKASVWSRIKMPDAGPVQRNAPTNGRGRVFSRLGPSANAVSSFYEPREAYFFRAKRPRLLPEDTEVGSGGIESLESSPDALEGEDYLHDDFDALEEASEREAEKVVDDTHGWTRKKASVANSGGDACIPNHHDEFANGKGGRRKLVRPVIGTSGQVDESGRLESLSKVTSGNSERNGVQPTGRSDTMDAGDALRTQEGEDSPVDPNSPTDDGRPDLEEDDIMSS